MNDTDLAVDIRNLSYQYPKARHRALQSLSLKIGQGDLFGLLGPNGAGKTTTISILSTLLKPAAGTVFIGGLDVRTHRRRVQKRIGLTPQDIALYDQLSAYENLSYFGRLQGLSGQRLKDRIAEGLHVSGLETFADQVVGRFSGGMKRRLNLAVGMINQPALMLLDEPTVGIDAQSRQLIFDQLKRLNQGGATIVYTTHYMEEASQLCTRVAIVDHGAVIAEGAPADLVASYDGCADLGMVFLQLTGKSLRDI
jgi:ABC-2 type transport system ATP-binding protein